MADYDEDRVARHRTSDDEQQFDDFYEICRGLERSA